MSREKKSLNCVFICKRSLSLGTGSLGEKGEGGRVTVTSAKRAVPFLPLNESGSCLTFS